MVMEYYQQQYIKNHIDSIERFNQIKKLLKILFLQNVMEINLNMLIQHIMKQCQLQLNQENIFVYLMQIMLLLVFQSENMLLLFLEVLISKLLILIQIMITHFLNVLCYLKLNHFQNMLQDSKIKLCYLLVIDLNKLQLVSSMLKIKMII